MSPYLFIIAQDVLSIAISKAVRNNFLSEVKAKRGCPPVSHLFFVDDYLIFIKASLKECCVLKRALNLYCNASGQLVNF